MVVQPFRAGRGVPISSGSLSHPLERGRSDCGVLEADAGQICDGDLPGARASFTKACDNFTEFGRLVPHASVDPVLQLAEGCALRSAIHDDEVGPSEAEAVELLLPG